MEIKLLGPLEVCEEGVFLRIPGEKLRSVIAVLALSPGRPVSRHVLIDELWGETPPRNAENSLHGHIARLRRVLAAGSGKPGLRDVIATSPSGYALTGTDIEVDAVRFAELVRRAESLGDGRPEEAAALLTEATDLWRGPALVDTGQGDTCRMAFSRLQQTRITAAEKLFDLRLRLGQHLSILSELEHLHAMYPFHERFCAQLITALYRSGRQADALDAYSQMSERLSHSLGLDPGRDLQSKFYGILRQDPALL
ncbi:BTAD domain-containing putative transcriptional regulator [Streptomyces sp. NPDC090442]|uniref:AfsR/SARP family transcriptional regulator n=1 Tax=Streptomyces sp. NPDC090442 TaxID=3365962 RepID=UPI003803E99E